MGVEGDGSITGIADRHRDPSRMAAVIFNNTQPPQSVRVSILDEGGQQVAELEVDRCDRPVANLKGTFQRRRLRSDGKPECAPFLSHEWETRASDLGKLDYTHLPVREATLADLDPAERVHLRAAIERYHGDRALLALDDDELAGVLGLVADGVPTVAGLLMLGGRMHSAATSHDRLRAACPRSSGRKPASRSSSAGGSVQTSLTPPTVFLPVVPK